MRAAKHIFIMSLYLLVLHTVVEITSAYKKMYNPEPSWVYRTTWGKVGGDLGMISRFGYSHILSAAWVTNLFALHTSVVYFVCPTCVA